MIRLVAITALVAATFALPAAAARPLASVQVTSGVYSAVFEVADGYEGHVVSAAEYARLVRDGACASNSHVSVWLHARHVSFVCELG